MQNSKDNFPVLADLLGGWFHEDFDIEGDTVEEILRAYKATSSDKECRSLVKELLRLMQTEKNALDEEFIRIFNPSIIATEFAPTTFDFLLDILIQVKDGCNIPPASD